jgi:tetratricopeptide (TPR) repeat protein
LVIVLIVGVGGFIWWDDRQAARVADNDRKRLIAEFAAKDQQQVARDERAHNVTAAQALLDQAKAALKAGDANRATPPLARAEAQITHGGLSDLSPELKQCRDDLVTLKKLDQIDDDRWTPRNGKLSSVKTSVPEWKTAFAKYGIIPGVTPPGEAARRINTSLIRERLLISLEVWFQGSGRDPVLRNILAEADPDEFRNRVRAADSPKSVLANGHVPDQQPVWFTIANGQDDSLDRGLREQLLLSAYRVRPDSFPLLMSLAGLDAAHDRAGAHRTIGWCRAALIVRPESVAAWSYLGVALYVVGDLPRAVEALKEATRLDPTSPFGYINLGLALDESQRFVEAITAFNTAIKRNPKSASAYLRLGVTLYYPPAFPNRLARAIVLGWAIDTLEKARSLDDKNAEVHYRLGTAYSNAGNRARGIAECTRATEIDPNDPKARYFLGRVLVADGRFPDAIAALKEAVRLDPTFIDAHFMLGHALDHSGERSDAAAAFCEVIRLDSKNALAHYRLANVYLQQNNTTAALAAAQNAVTLDPTNPNAHGVLGLALEKANDIAGARAALTEAARLDWKTWGPQLKRLPPVAPAATPAGGDRVRN